MTTPVGPPLSINEIEDPHENLLPAPLDDFERPITVYSPPDSPRFRQDWRPDDYQFSLSHGLLGTGGTAGFFRDGLSVTDLVNDGEGHVTVDVTGFSTARESIPLELEGHYVRKRPLFRPDSQGVARAVPGAFRSSGPSLSTHVGYQHYQFSDHRWGVELGTEEFQRVAGQAVMDSLIEVERWMNSESSGLLTIPTIINQAFGDYDPSEDYDIISDDGTEYGVHSFSFDQQLCLEQGHYRYDRRLDPFPRGKICLEGSAKTFIGNGFGDHLYVGAGPYLEWSLLDYHHKPFKNREELGLDHPSEFAAPALTSSFYVYAGGHYYNGFSFKDGFDDHNRFVDVDLGVGLRQTLPSLRPRRFKD